MITAPRKKPGKFVVISIHPFHFSINFRGAGRIGPGNNNPADRLIRREDE
jgi:hypothetical protein